MKGWSDMRGKTMPRGKIRERRGCLKGQDDVKGPGDAIKTEYCQLLSGCLPISNAR